MRKFHFGVVVFVLMLLAAAVKYAEPVSDSDIWFHLAYGRQFVENHTLVPDHSAFSWTRTDSDFIYCAWIPEIVFYGLYSLGGMNALYGLRYSIIILFLVLAWSISPKGRGFFNPVLLLACFIGLLMSYGGLRIKPEIVSFALMALTAWVWFRIKEQPERSRRLAWLFPVIMAVWVNSHGGFLFGVIFLGAVVAGEVLNLVLGSAERLDSRSMKHLLAASSLCAPALLLTPYWWRYPAQLLDTLVLNPAEFQEHQRTIVEYQTIFIPQASSLHFIDFFAVAALVLTTLLVIQVKRKRADLALWLVNAVFALIYTRYLRTTYFWAIIFVFSTCFLIRRIPWAELSFPRRDLLVKSVRWLSLAVLAFLAVRSQYEIYCGQTSGYISQKEEADFIRSNLPGLVMGNDYFCGAYFLWALHPERKVFIDARYFPYREWYDDYTGIMYGTDKGDVARLLEKYPCDFWCITYDTPALGFFSASPEWRLAYYGPSACIYVSRHLPSGTPGRVVSPDVYRQGIVRAYSLAGFASSVGDFDIAERIVRSMQPAPFCPSLAGTAVRARLNAGSSLLSRGRHHDAMDFFSQAIGIYEKDPLLRRFPGSPMLRDIAGAHDRLGYCLMVAGRTGEAYRELTKAATLDSGSANARKYIPVLRAGLQKVDEGIARLEDALKGNPGDMKILGSLAALYSVKGEYDRAREYLDREIRISPDSPDAYYNMACIYSKEGKVQKSLEHLDIALKKGFRDHALMRTDPDLDNVRKLPGFAELMERSGSGNK